LKVRVVLHSLLRYKLARETRGRLTLDLPDNSSIQDLLDEMGIVAPINVSINNRIVDNFETLLDENVEIHLFHPTGGGISPTHTPIER
jgi:sulfur carrier protein ThiS